MFPPPEILGYSINWFELITVLSILITLVFGRLYFSINQPNSSFKSVLFPLGSLLIVGYGATYLMAYLEGQTYGLVKNNVDYFVKFGTHKKFMGFVCLIFLLVVWDSFFLKRKFISQYGDYLAIVICLFIVLEANACLFDGHGCYGRFTNLPWGMLFLHGSAPTILPVHPTPLYISICHLLLFILLFVFKKNSLFENRLLLILLMATSVINFGIEFLKNTDELLLAFNFTQIVYALIGISSLMLLFKNESKTPTKTIAL